MGGMTPQADWLAQLAPDRVPAPAGWWPPAPGWWALAILLVLVLAALWWWWRSPARRLRAATLRALRELERGGVDDAGFATALELLLRRYAISRYGRARVARLSGAAWMAFVAGHGGSELDGAAGRAFMALVYGGSGAADRARWIRAARGFVRARNRGRRSTTADAAVSAGRRLEVQP